LLVLLVFFLFSWTIVGALLFWKQISPLDICTGPVKSYLTAVLVTNMLPVSLMCGTFVSLVFGAE
jgi:hypothetical protein